MYPEPQTLIVVYKDELLLNVLRKLIETNDDISEEQIVGTKDGSVTIVAWTEKIWLEQKKAGDISSKILFLEDVKGTESLSPIINWKFEQFGVKYGWSGKQALLVADSKGVKKREDYKRFLDVFKNEVSLEQIANKKKKLGLNTSTILKGVGLVFTSWFGVLFGGSLIKDVFDDAAIVRQQQYIYGIEKMYMNHLEEFMKS